MSVRRVKVGTADVSVTLRIADSTDGTPETGVVFNTSGIDLWYRREGAASVDITEATLSALTDAHTDGGFLAISDGWYRLDLPDAACASGATGVQIGGTVTGMVVFGPYIELVAYDPYDTVRLGLTALPNAAADAAGGLPISDAGGLDLDAQIGTDIDAILVDTAEIGAAGAGLTVLATAANLTTVDTVVDAIKAVTDSLPDSGALTSLATAANLATAAGYIDTEVAAIKAVTDNLPDSGALTSLATAAALTTVDTVVDGIKAVTDNLPDSGAFTTIDGKIDAIDNFIDTEVAEILTDTGTTLDDLVDDLEGRLTAALATVLQAHSLGVGRGVVDASSSTTAIVIKSLNGGAASATDDHYNGRHVVITSGAMILQAASITDYVGSTKTLTVSAMTGTPAEDVTFLII